MGELRQAENDFGVRYWYRMTSGEAFKAASAALWVAAAGAALMALELSHHDSFPTPGSGLFLIFFVVGVVSFVRWRSSNWVVGKGFAGQRRSNGTESRQVDLNALNRVRITTKWWTVRDRTGGKSMIPAEMLQHREVVECLIAGVRSSQLTGSVDMDSTMALLLSSADRAPDDPATGGNETQSILAAGHSRGFWPVLNRALNIWMGFVIAILLFAVLLLLVTHL